MLSPFTKIAFDHFESSVKQTFINKEYWQYQKNDSFQWLIQCISEHLNTYKLLIHFNKKSIYVESFIIVMFSKVSFVVVFLNQHI